VVTDKINFLSGDPSIHIQHSIQHPDGNANWLYDRLNDMAARLTRSRTIEAAAVQPLTAQPALPNGATASDSGAETGFKAKDKARLKRKPQAA
jgi:hypothetical protein